MKRLFLIAVVIGMLVAPGCTNKQGETEAPVFLTLTIQEQPGFINVAVIAPVQVRTMILQSRLKNPTQTDPQHFADVIIEGYRVHYRRTDGGTRVPPDQLFGAAGTVPSGGQSTLNNFPILHASQIQLAPFDQLLPFNGGVDRETGRNEIDTAWDITFFGRTVAGQRVESETATGLLLFRFTPLSTSTSPGTSVR